MEYSTVKFRKKTFINEDTGEKITGIFSKERITNVPAGKFKYEIRHSDFDSTLARTIEPKVMVNFYGTFITETQLSFPDANDPYISIKTTNRGKRSL
jgi:hypothetical protein